MIEANDNYLATISEVLKLESDAIASVRDCLDISFAKAISSLLSCNGHVILLGVGKSGLIAKKIAATFASTGTPSFFVHADEALHGDLGMITEHDLVIAISYSGKTEEVVRSVSSVKRNNIPVIAISHSENSPLAKLSDIHLKVAVEKEAGTLNLAPSCSTTATLAVGDALALCVSKFKLFTPKDFAGSHPGGALGKKLLFSVRDVMRSGSELPLVNVRDTVSDAVREISLKGLGFCMISDDNGHVQGVFTDGDLRRALQEESSEIKDKAVNLFMTRFPKTISANNPATAALDIMEKEKIKQLIVIEDNKLVGVVYLLDMLKAKVI